MVTMLDITNNNVKHIEHLFVDNVRMTLQDRMLELFEEFPTKKKSHLAKFVGVTRTTPSDWTSGKTKKIDADHAYKAAKYFDDKIEPHWLATGDGPKYKADYIDSHEVRKDLPGLGNSERGPDINGKVPLISTVQAGMWAEIIDNFHVGDAEKWIDTTAKITDSMFALRVVGDSMVNPAGFPSLPPGVNVIVDPEKRPENGKIVVARLDDSMEATIKQLVIDGNQTFLKPLNPHYPVIPIAGNCTIVGVAVKVEFDI